LQALSAQTTELNDGIVAIDTEYVRALQDASHLVLEDGRAAYVDTGTNNSVPLLLDALQQRDLDVADVDYVFLTHIHLDHAGGAGALMQALPNAQCVVHPRGARHMIDPTKLIAGTEAVYGKQQTQRLYGTILPIDAARVVVPDDEEWFDLNGRALQTIFTEGHARHHYCLNDPSARGVFTGDSFGVSYRELDTAAGEFIFPTTTPASFDPPQAHKSVDRIMSCDPENLFLTHYSRVRDLARLAADMHAGIDTYVEIAVANKAAADPAADIEADLLAHLSARLIEHGYTGGDDAAHAVLGLDAKLNAQGLVSWLHRLAR
jgi:glyoxylase-like metal-dependent hydrolase (beta-lactamase superfamily II)